MSDFDIVRTHLGDNPSTRAAEALDRIEEAAKGVVNWVASIPEDEDSPGAEWAVFEDAIATLRAALEGE